MEKKHKFREGRMRERQDAFDFENFMEEGLFRRRNTFEIKIQPRQRPKKLHKSEPMPRPMPVRRVVRAGGVRNWSKKPVALEYNNRVVNYMDGTSYTLDPVETMKMTTASSIFAEPMYYRAGKKGEAYLLRDGIFAVHPVLKEYVLLDARFIGKKTSQIMEELIDNALSHDFAATIRWAETLRKEYMMRLNPQVLMVRAALHPERVRFDEENPGVFRAINDRVMARADEPGVQLAYYCQIKGSKAGIPNILKRSWANRIERMTAYEVYKYRNHGVKLIDVIRICHAKGAVIDQLMKTGTVEAKEEATWEAMRSQGCGWREILETNRIMHMALLRNLRGAFSEIDDIRFCENMMERLKAGVPGGKQFPFRYYSALRAVKETKAVHHRPVIMDALEECMDISCANMPSLPGKTMCLSDNSGSAWGAMNSEYGSVVVAEIDNLSSVITARNSEEGYVGVFGDTLQVIPIGCRGGVLAQAEEANRIGRDVGMGTENGVWLFFKEALEKKEHWDNIFIYSDMQAGHGGLFGMDCSEYEEFRVDGDSMNIDVAKLIEAYRRSVNPKVNVFCVQTAGYDNVLVPENGYRTSVLYGWTGRELVYADAINRFWDETDAKKQGAKEE